MKKILNYLKTFHQDYFSLRLYFMVACFISVLIAINYAIDLEDSYVDTTQGLFLRTLWFYLVHGVAYYGTLTLIWLYDKTRITFTKGFWIKSLIAFLIISFDRSLYPEIYRALLSDVPREVFTFYRKVLVNTYGLFTVILPILLFKIIFDRNEKEGLYGLRFSKVDVKMYWVMLLFMIPILFFASYIPDIADYYPSYKRTNGLAFAQFYHLKEWVSVFIYETVYVSDFLSTELFFRGLLIVGLSKSLGKNAVLPMVATYAALHFGKPMGEAISSIFGGYLLGIIALYSRNIWGGVFIHGGIAFLMEIFAFLRM